MHLTEAPLDDCIPVVAYARISDDTEKDGHGVRDQHRVNRQTAKRLGRVIVAELTDNDRSASKADVVRWVGEIPGSRCVCSLAEVHLVRQE
ncbi:hypothetical protein [Cryptosporangium aurantiacum]|uniref:hypothetical protein n=1 Tax=Cryptosporangium aurantiacum TaxID=134849 RepID=UPI0015BC1EDE|nr:hypothetical protein [Cryptosporangium aurantiacum]